VRSERGATAIWVHGRASGEPVNAWLQSCDFEADDGRGVVTVTTNPFDALVFDGFLQAMQYWKTQSTTRPLRPDGKPNRPLTAYTVSPMKLPIFDHVYE
jgi:hypothetical protein